MTETVNIDGYIVVRDVVGAVACDEIISHLPPTLSAGSRTLLDSEPIRRLVHTIRDHRGLSRLLNNRVAVQCTYFRKTQDVNWSVGLHRDTAFPIEGKGYWKKSGTKEGMNFVRPPLDFARQLIAVRLNLDDAGEGDLCVVSRSHREIDSAAASERVTVFVPKGGVLVMSPLLLHSSTKLVRAGARRVLHFVFGPRQLPGSYQWYSAF